MSITVTVQPDARTTVEIADDPMAAPTLILGAGPIEIVVEPAGVAGGMAAAAEFARLLAQAVTTWEQVCAGRIASAEQDRQAHPYTEQREGGS